MEKNQWKDLANRVWTIRLTFGKCRQLRDRLNVDLIDQTKVNQLTALLADRNKLAAVLWHLAQEQVEGLSQEDFEDSLDADSLSDGWNALVEAFVSFCPPPTRGAVMSAIEEETLAMEAAAKAMQALIESTDTKQMVDKAIGTMVTEAKAAMLGKLP